MEIQRVGCFYVDKKRRFEDDPKKGRCYLHEHALSRRFHLKDGFPNQYDYHVMGNERLDLIQQFLMERQYLLDDVDFVTRRGILSKIMDMRSSVYEFFVARHNSVIYMSASEGRRDVTKDPIEFSARKFERCIFADKKGDEPDCNAIVSNAEAWHVVFKRKFGQFNIMFSAEIDGIDPKNSKSDDLKDLSFVEAKMRKAGTPRMYLSNMWSQSYLSGVDKLVIAWRDYDCRVDRIEVMHPRDVRPTDSETRIKRLTNVLTHLKGLTKNVDDPEVVWRVIVTATTVRAVQETGQTFFLKKFLAASLV